MILRAKSWQILFQIPTLLRPKLILYTYAYVNFPFFQKFSTYMFFYFYIAYRMCTNFVSMYKYMYKSWHIFVRVHIRTVKLCTYNFFIIAYRIFCTRPSLFLLFSLVFFISTKNIYCVVTYKKNIPEWQHSPQQHF